MKSIWKFELPFKEMAEVQMPEDAEILTVQVDEKTNRPCIWAMVYTENETESRYIELIGTGGEAPADMGIDRKYIGTFQISEGEFVGHVFERL